MLFAPLIMINVIAVCVYYIFLTTNHQIQNTDLQREQAQLIRKGTLGIGLPTGAGSFYTLCPYSIWSVWISLMYALSCFPP
ncbi:hypothetical protein [Ectobacillus ponti]|uniref:Uncharacterized protein n=1 Tax=Ectobacillus ponti TaxID=2961894 RepID=A0AA41XCR5_9BACI|nr:hypothetical protein [Ectobacillus ponti]MCP8971045.1 hypothetical protein [Ectobacillus ponti]